METVQDPKDMSVECGVWVWSVKELWSKKDQKSESRADIFKRLKETAARNRRKQTEDKIGTIKELTLQAEAMNKTPEGKKKLEELYPQELLKPQTTK